MTNFFIVCSGPEVSEQSMARLQNRCKHRSEIFSALSPIVVGMVCLFTSRHFFDASLAAGS